MFGVVCGLWETIQIRRRRMQNGSASNRMNKPIKSAKQPGKQRPKRRSKVDAVPARFIEPMLLQLVSRLPEGAQWQYEVKWDGYRGVAVIQNGEARLWSRNERDLGKRFASIVDALASIPARSAVIDGELVELGDDGKPSFQALDR